MRAPGIALVLACLGFLLSLAAGAKIPNLKVTRLCQIAFRKVHHCSGAVSPPSVAPASLPQRCARKHSGSSMQRHTKLLYAWVHLTHRALRLHLALLPRHLPNSSMQWQTERWYAWVISFCPLLYFGVNNSFSRKTGEGLSLWTGQGRQMLAVGVVRCWRIAIHAGEVAARAKPTIPVVEARPASQSVKDTALHC